MIKFEYHNSEIVDLADWKALFLTGVIIRGTIKRDDAFVMSGNGFEIDVTVVEIKSNDKISKKAVAGNNVTLALYNYELCLNGHIPDNIKFENYDTLIFTERKKV